MAYDEELAGRMRAALSFETGITEKRMFGGLAFMVEGHMVAAANRDGGMMLRLDPDAASGLVDGERVRPFHMNGRDLGGWLSLAPEVVEDPDELRAWLERGVAHVRSLPPR